MFAVQADGSKVTTVRGLAPEGELAPAPAELPGPCRLAVRVLHARDDRDRAVVPGPAPARRTARSCARRWSGNLCRCTGYTKILDALEAYRDGRTEEAPVVGLSTKTRTLPTCVCRARPGCASPRTATSSRRWPAPCPTPTTGASRGCCTAWSSERTCRARKITGIDVTAAAPLPGVRAVLTAADVPHNVIVEEASGLGSTRSCSRCWRPTGSATTASRSRSSPPRPRAPRPRRPSWSRSHYEDLPGVFDAEAALAEGAPAVHAGGNRWSAGARRSATSRPRWPPPTWSSRGPTEASTSTTPTSSPRRGSAGWTATACSRSASPPR